MRVLSGLDAREADLKKVRQALVDRGPPFFLLVLPYHYMSNIVMDKNMPESAFLLSRVHADALSTRRFCNQDLLKSAKLYKNCRILALFVHDGLNHI